MSNLSSSDERSLEMMRVATRWVYAVYPVVWTILSIGNILSLIVFLRPSMRKVHNNVFLAALAVTDMIFVNSSTWPNMQDFIQGGPSLHNIRFWAKARIWQYLLHIGNYLTGWLLVIISADRFIMIQYPMWSKVHATPKKAMLSLLTCLPFIIYTMHNFYGRDGLNYVSESYKNFYVNIDLNIIAPSVNMTIMLLMIIFNGLIIFKILQQVKNRKMKFGLSAEKKSQAASLKITKMLLIVSVFAMLLKLPVQFLNISINATLAYDELDEWWHDFWYLIIGCSYALNYLNSCINFFVYIGMSSNFRKEFKNVFCRCCKNDAEKARKPQAHEQGPDKKLITMISDVI